MSASYLLLGHGPLPPDSTHDRPLGTPVYDALVDEFRLALRTVPGDQGSAEIVPSPQFPLEFGFAALARRPAVAVPRQISRHRGAPGDNRSELRY